MFLLLVVPRASPVIDLACSVDFKKALKRRPRTKDERKSLKSMIFNVIRAPQAAARGLGGRRR